MIIKKGVVVDGLKEPMQKAWRWYERLYELAGGNPVATDIMREPSNGKYSLHEDGYAIDCRGRDLSVEKGAQLAKILQDVLGDDYDVIYYGNSYKHYHIEYQRHLDDAKEWDVDNVKEVD